MIIAHLSAAAGWAIVGLLAFSITGVITLTLRQYRLLGALEHTAEALKVLADQLCVLKKDKE